MQLAEIPRLSINRSLAAIMRSQQMPQWMAGPFIIVTFWRPVRKMAKDIESVADKYEVLWKRVIGSARNETGFVTSESEVRQIARDLKDAGDQLVRDIITSPFEPYFPRYVSRTRAALDRIEKLQRTYFPIAVCESDKEAIAEADRHYTQGTLMDFETFADGLQRH
jgi:hypothetical protein